MCADPACPFCAAIRAAAAHRRASPDEAAGMRDATLEHRREALARSREDDEDAEPSGDPPPGRHAPGVYWSKTTRNWRAMVWVGGRLRSSTYKGDDGGYARAAAQAQAWLREREKSHV